MSSCRLNLAAAVAAMTVLGASPRVMAAQAPPDVAALLASAGAYVTEYERQSSAIVALERYVQFVRRPAPTARRELQSDLLVLNTGEAGWVGFRDVFEVDGRSVRDHEERLYKLFLHPSPDAVLQATKLVDESARFNIGNVNRNINLPMTALMFLRPQFQGRSTFTAGGAATVDRVRTRVLEFVEHTMPRTIKTSDNAAARGRFWIEPNSGRVLRTELAIDSTAGTTTTAATITVNYAPQPALGDLWLPVSMTERYTQRAETIDGRATYSNFRKFNVDVATIIK